LDNVIILDTDMASVFAKIKRLELLKRLFSKYRCDNTRDLWGVGNFAGLWIYISTGYI